MITSRRSLITGFASLLAAPAIVRASSIMPVKAWADGAIVHVTGCDDLLYITMRGYNIFTGEPISMRMPIIGAEGRAQLPAGCKITGLTLPGSSYTLAPISGLSAF